MVNETWLRWKGRLGQLKAAGLLIVIFGGIGLLLLGDSIATVLNNSSNPRPVTLDQFVNGQIGTNQFVGVAGKALYGSYYYYTSDKGGTDEEDYYLLVDTKTGNMLIVRSPTVFDDSKPSKTVTIYGVTHSLSSDLQNLIDNRKPTFTKDGFKVNTAIYVTEGELPPSPIVVLLPAAIIVVLILLSIVTFFMPNTVFVAQPIDGSVIATDFKSNVQATGQFQQLASTNPIQYGKGKRKFVRSVANIWPMQDRSWFIYIHFIYTYRVNGVPVRKTETDWGIPLNTANVTDVQSGKLYGLKDRWAVQFKYKDLQEKQQTLLISFKEPGAQAAFVRALSQSGMYVGSGDTTSLAFGN